MIEAHEPEFREFGSTEPAEVMKILSLKDGPESSLVRGLLLGFPFESVRKFEEARNTHLPRKGVNIYGIHWMDFGESEESVNKQQRLKQAFESSGILKI